MSNTILLRAYTYRRCQQFTFELCKEQGWFDGKCFDDLTDADKKQVYWQNNLQIAIRSYVFWNDYEAEEDEEEY